MKSFKVIIITSYTAHYVFGYNIKYSKIFLMIWNLCYFNLLGKKLKPICMGKSNHLSCSNSCANKYFLPVLQLYNSIYDLIVLQILVALLRAIR